MQKFAPFALACSLTLFVAGCSKGDDAAKDSAAAAAAATPAPPPAPAPFAMVDAAGKWQMSSVPESGTDTATTKYVLTATADTTGWVMTFPSGVKVPLHVMVSGDSVIATSGKFASQRRKGVQVMTDGSFRLQDGKLVGHTTAHYSGKGAGADSVLQMRTEGTKMP